MLRDLALRYIDDNKDKCLKLLKTITEIPAPTGDERRRSEFIENYLENAGAVGVYRDKAGNVVYPYDIRPGRHNAVMIAHMDTVFKLETLLEVTENSGKLLCPGIGDDTANLVCLLLLAVFAAKEKPSIRCGIFFVFGVGEEGLGNLKGSRRFMEEHADKVSHFWAFDLYYRKIYTDVVGSIRYRISINTVGGHSYLNFGNPNAIYVASQIINDLYRMKPSDEESYTYNVGTIAGGNSVNSIAEQASFTMEFRTGDPQVMRRCDQAIHDIVKRYRPMTTGLSMELLGKRPCAQGVPEESVEKMIGRARESIRSIIGIDPEESTASTDCNIPLSMGVPAICIGLCDGALLHTTEEWIWKDSVAKGLRLLFHLVYKYYFDED
jgi:acetylornithine deacetylase/succinyl-diaminopimelate desuccinylase-like protein